MPDSWLRVFSAFLNHAKEHIQFCICIYELNSDMKMLDGADRYHLRLVGKELHQRIFSIRTINENEIKNEMYEISLKKYNYVHKNECLRAYITVCWMRWPFLPHRITPRNKKKAIVPFQRYWLLTSIGIAYANVFSVNLKGFRSWGSPLYSIV